MAEDIKAAAEDGQIASQRLVSSENSIADVPSVQFNFMERLIKVESTASNTESVVQAMRTDLNGVRSEFSNLHIAGGVVLAVLSIFCVTLLFTVKRAISKAITERFSKEAQSRFEERFSEALSKTQQQYVTFTHILSLVDAGKFEQALRHDNFEGAIEPRHREYPEIVQVALIKAISRSDRFQGDGKHGSIAWSWATELIAQSVTAARLRCVLELSSKIGEEDEAFEIYERTKASLREHERQLLDPLLLVLLRRLRHRGDVQSQIVSICKRLQDSKEIDVVVNVAAVVRDLGDFDAADSLMRRRIIEARAPMEYLWNASWARLYNTLLANAVDMNDVSTSVDDCKTLLAMSARPDHAFSCMRVAWRLKPGEERDSIVAAVKQRLASQSYAPQDDGTWKSQALVHAIDGSRDKAIELVKLHRKRLEELAGAVEGARKWALGQIYYLRCLVAELLLGEERADKDPDDLDLAIAELEPVLKGDKKGEASFLAARAAAARGDHKSADSYIEQALTAGGKWVARAKRCPELRESRRVLSLHVQLPRWVS